jgi:hypothetical protein
VGSTSRRLVITPDHRDDPSEGGWERRLRALSESPDAILSDENLLGDPRDGYAMAPARVALLRDCLHRSPFQVVVYLRPQLDWLGSVFLQGVQEGRTGGSEEFLAGVLEQPYLDWARIVSLLQDNSGAQRVVVRAYDASRDAVEDFFRASGLGPPPRGSRTAGRDNVSISPLQAPILLALNEGSSLKREERWLLRQAFQGVLAPADRIPLSPFPESTQRIILDRFVDQWLGLADSVHELDPQEAAVFRRMGREWGTQLSPFPGASVMDPLIAAEMIRCLRLLIGYAGVPPSPSLWSRAWAKMLENPRDFPGAVGRRLHP